MLLRDKFGIEDSSPYEVTAPKQIARMLDSMCEARMELRLQRHAGDAPLGVRILSVDAAAGTLDLLPPLPAIHDRRVPDTAGLWAESDVDGVHTLFAVPGLRLKALTDGPVWEMPVPVTLIRLQRREYYRVPAPPGALVQCTLPTRADPAGAKAVLALNDISLGGASLVDRLGIMDATVGKLYQNCRLHLPIGVPVDADLVVANTRERVLPDGQTVRTVGCRFEALPRPMAAAVQRYILQLERDGIARALRPV